MELFLYGKSNCLFHRYDGFHPYISDVRQNISTQASTRLSTWVLVPEYQYKCEYCYFGTHEWEQSTSTRNWVLSMSTPALVPSNEAPTLLSYFYNGKLHTWIDSLYIEMGPGAIFRTAYVNLRCDEKIEADYVVYGELEDKKTHYVSIICCRENLDHSFVLRVDSRFAPSQWETSLIGWVQAQDQPWYCVGRWTIIKKATGYRPPELSRTLFIWWLLCDICKPWYDSCHTSHGKVSIVADDGLASARCQGICNNQQESTLFFLASCPKIHFLGWYKS